MAAELHQENGRWYCRGEWSLPFVADLETQLDSLAAPDRPLTLDGGALQQLDSAGAWLLYRLREQLAASGQPIELESFAPAHLALLQLIEEHMQGRDACPPPDSPNPLAVLGKQTVDQARDLRDFLHFLGETTLHSLHEILHPLRIRWVSVAANLEQSGLHALPIVGLMAFLIGIVLAYQGGSQLRLYGANIFIVELVTITLLRELAPLLTAIMLAGRSGSAFTAQIATMKITEEIDALRTIGIAPASLLIIPKLIALMIALPLLSVFADIAGIFGGMLVASLSLDVSFGDFLQRLQQQIDPRHFYLGLIKAPFFAAVIVLIACYQGFKVSGGADSVGRQVTISVVQSIFLVIMLDALFSILFNWAGV